MRRVVADGKVMNHALLEELNDLVERDVRMREKLLREDRLYGSYDEAMQQIHRDNAVRLSAIVECHGWPGVSLVGLEGARAAWLIAQHAICTPDLQRGFLKRLELAAEVGDAPKKQVALLTDRIRFNEGRAQVYGTVFDWDASGQLNCVVEDPETVDARRASVGLESFDAALSEQRARVTEAGGRPPSDYSAYKAAADRWAQQAGWR